MNSYALSRAWFDFCFNNPEKVNTNHAAIYFFAIEHCNRLGWKTKFGFPSQMVMEAIGIKNWRTYSKNLNDLVDFGFIEMIQKSKNQYSSNIISLCTAYVKNTEADTKALDKAITKQDTKHSQSIVSINKPLNKELLNLITSNETLVKQNLKRWIIEEKNKRKNSYRSFKHLSISLKEVEKLKEDGNTIEQINEILDSIENYKKNANYTSLYLTAKKWLKLEKEKSPAKKEKDERPIFDQKIDHFING